MPGSGLPSARIGRGFFRCSAKIGFVRREIRSATCCKRHAVGKIVSRYRLRQRIVFFGGDAAQCPRGLFDRFRFAKRPCARELKRRYFPQSRSVGNQARQRAGYGTFSIRWARGISSIRGACCTILAHVASIGQRCSAGGPGRAVVCQHLQRPGSNVEFLDTPEETLQPAISFFAG